MIQPAFDPVQTLKKRTQGLEFRPMTLDLDEAVIALARGTNVFRDQEIKALAEVIEDYFKEFRDLGHLSEVALVDGELAGFLYYAPNPLAVGTWQLWWILVREDLRGQGFGARLLQHAEHNAHEAKGRLMFIETSSQENYLGTQKFYLKHGYEKEAQLRDFYQVGDDMIIFRKRL